MSSNPGSGVVGGPSALDVLEDFYDEYIGRGLLALLGEQPPGQEEARPRGQGRRGPEERAERAEGVEEGGGSGRRQETENDSPNKIVDGSGPGHAGILRDGDDEEEGVDANAAKRGRRGLEGIEVGGTKRHCSEEAKNAALNVGDGSVGGADTRDGIGHQEEGAAAGAAAAGPHAEPVAEEPKLQRKLPAEPGFASAESSPGRTTPTLLGEDADIDFSGGGDSFEDAEQQNSLDEAQHVANDDAAAGQPSGEPPAPQLAQPGEGDGKSSSQSGNEVEGEAVEAPVEEEAAEGRRRRRSRVTSYKDPSSDDDDSDRGGSSGEESEEYEEEEEENESDDEEKKPKARAKGGKRSQGGKKGKGKGGAPSKERTAIARNCIIGPCADVYRLVGDATQREGNPALALLLWNSEKGKLKNFNMNADYAIEAAEAACTAFNEKTGESLSRKQFVDEFLPPQSINREKWLADARERAGCGAPTSVGRDKITAARKNGREGRGPQKLCSSKYGPHFVQLLGQLERNVRKMRKRPRVAVGAFNAEALIVEMSDIDAELRRLFGALRNMEKAVEHTILELETSERIGDRFCGSGFGGGEYSPEELAELFMGPTEGLMAEFDEWCAKFGVKNDNGKVSTRKFTGVCSQNEFMTKVMCLFHGLAVLVEHTSMAIEEKGNFDAMTKNDGVAYLGAEVEAEFECKGEVRPFRGIVKDFDVDKKLFLASYEDGYEEEVAAEELADMLIYNFIYEVKPEGSIIRNQNCPGSLLRDIGCKCQVAQSYKVDKSIAYSLTSGILFNLNSHFAAPASGLSSDDRESGHYDGVLLGDDCIAQRMKVTYQVVNGLPTYNVNIPATRDVSKGLKSCENLKLFAPSTTCDNCKDTELADFAGGSKKVLLHRLTTTWGTDSTEMVYNGSPYCPQVQHHLEKVVGYASVEQWLGYSDNVKERIEKNGLYRRTEQQYIDQLEERADGECTDTDHFLKRRSIYSNGSYRVGGCSHATNQCHTFPRTETNDHCYGFALIPYN